MTGSTLNPIAATARRRPPPPRQLRADARPAHAVLGRPLTRALPDARARWLPKQALRAQCRFVSAAPAVAAGPVILDAAAVESSDELNHREHPF